MRRLLPLSLITAAGLWACSTEEPTVRVDSHAPGVFVAGEVDSMPRVEYGAWGVTLNDRCMVRKVKLNRKMPPMYVNNFPIGFC